MEENSVYYLIKILHFKSNLEVGLITKILCLQALLIIFRSVLHVEVVVVVVVLVVFIVVRSIYEVPKLM